MSPNIREYKYSDIDCHKNNFQNQSENYNLTWHLSYNTLTAKVFCNYFQRGTTGCSSINLFSDLERAWGRTETQFIIVMRTGYQVVDGFAFYRGSKAIKMHFGNSLQ